MHPRKGNGWGGIVPSEDLTSDPEQTDPNLEMPTFEAGSEEKTTIAHNPTLPPQKQKQRAPQKSKLTLPRPESDPSRGSPPPPAVEFAVEVDQLVQKLEPERKDSAKKKKEERLFTKEVILTLVGGVLLLGGAFAYSRSDGEAPALPVAPPPPLAPVTPAPPPPVVETKVEEPPPPVETTVKATTPILSILSIPSGARVEIDGTIYGTTPLIQPSPPNVKSMAIRLLKDNFKDFETILTPNEAGHFNLNATLEKR